MPYFESGGGIEVKRWSGNFGATQGNTLNYLTDQTPIAVIGAKAYNKANQRWENIPIQTTNSVNLSHVEAFDNCIRLYIDSAAGVTHFGGQEVVVYYIQQ